MNSVKGQTQGQSQPQQDTTRIKDPINRMHDSTRLRQMMRDSNFMKKPNHNLKDSMPMKKGWMDEDSTSENSTTVYVYSYKVSGGIK